MSTAWIKETFGVEKPIIAMCHLQAMPSDPGYDAEKGMDWVIEMARHDLTGLQNGGVDAIMFSNEFSLPYLTKCRPVTAAAMARIIGELKSEIKVPFGVNVLRIRLRPSIWRRPRTRYSSARSCPAFTHRISAFGIRTRAKWQDINWRCAALI